MGMVWERDQHPQAEEIRQWLKDYGSTAGTSVIYGTENGGPRTNTEWIIAGDEFLEDKGPIIIKVTQVLQF